MNMCLTRALQSLDLCAAASARSHFCGLRSPICSIATVSTSALLLLLSSVPHRPPAPPGRRRAGPRWTAAALSLYDSRTVRRHLIFAVFPSIKSRGGLPNRPAHLLVRTPFRIARERKQRQKKTQKSYQNPREKKRKSYQNPGKNQKKTRKSYQNPRKKNKKNKNG